VPRRADWAEKEFGKTYPFAALANLRTLMLEDFTLQQEQDALASFSETNISANRGMAVEKSLPPKTRS
jgi:hypothetical protein